MKFVKTKEYLLRKVESIEKAILNTKSEISTRPVDRHSPDWFAYLAMLEKKLCAAKKEAL